MTRTALLAALIAAGATTLACSGLEGPVQPSSTSSDALANARTSAASAPPTAGPGATGAAATARASSCSVVNEGVALIVAGTRGSSGAIVATHVVKAPESASNHTPVFTPTPATPSPDGVPGTRLSILARGTARHVMGSCPELMFEVEGEPVATTASTLFFGE